MRTLSESIALPCPAYHPNPRKSAHSKHDSRDGLGLITRGSDLDRLRLIRASFLGPKGLGFKAWRSERGRRAGFGVLQVFGSRAAGLGLGSS